MPRNDDPPSPPESPAAPMPDASAAAPPNAPAEAPLANTAAPDAPAEAPLASTAAPDAPAEAPLANTAAPDASDDETLTDRVNPRVLRHIHVPSLPRTPRDHPPAEPPAVRLPRRTHDLRPFQEVGSFRALSPDTTLRLVSQAHVDYFAADFAHTGEDFIQIRYHLGGSRDPYELRSDPFHLDVDSYGPMRERLVEHIRTHLDAVPLLELGQIPVRMVYFHDARASAPQGAAPGVLAHPLDFACWVQLTVGEFAQFEVDGILPTHVRLGFDAGYLHLGDETAAPFRYVKHWRFFAELLLALSRTVQRPLSPQDAPIEMLVAHTRTDLADLVLGLAVQDRRTYESAARVYRPRVEVLFRADTTRVAFDDPQGMMRLFAMDLPTGPFHRTIRANRVVFTRHHAPC